MGKVPASIAEESESTTACHEIIIIGLERKDVEFQCRSHKKLIVQLSSTGTKGKSINTPVDFRI